jgi:hypothetical protein
MSKRIDYEAVAPRGVKLLGSVHPPAALIAKQAETQGN